MLGFCAFWKHSLRVAVCLLCLLSSACHQLHLEFLISGSSALWNDTASFCPAAWCALVMLRASNNECCTGLGLPRCANRVHIERFIVVSGLSLVSSLHTTLTSSLMTGPQRPINAARCGCLAVTCHTVTVIREQPMIPFDIFSRQVSSRAL